MLSNRETRLESVFQSVFGGGILGKYNLLDGFLLDEGTSACKELMFLVFDTSSHKLHSREQSTLVWCCFLFT